MATHARAIKTVDPGAKHGADLQALADIVGKARVVALGTPVYGAREVHQLQHRMVSYLVRELGFSAVVLEAPLPETFDVDAWIGTFERTDTPAPMSSLQYPFWQTKEMRATLHGLRAFDRASRGVGKTKRHVRLYGVDMLSPDRAIETVLDGLEPRRTEKVRSWLAPLVDPTAEPDAARLASIARRLERLEQVLRRKPAIDELGRRSVRVLIQHVAYLRAFPDRHMPARADAMVENIRWILDREGETSRLILWMHAGHIATKPYANTGRQLRELLGDAYVALGFTFGEGRFAGLDGSSARRGRLPLTLTLPPPAVLEGALSEVGEAMGAFMLDLRQLPSQGPAATYFGTPQAIRYITGAYDEMKPESGFHRIDVPGYYDALVYVDRITPTALNSGAN